MQASTAITGTAEGLQRILERHIAGGIRMPWQIAIAIRGAIMLAHAQHSGARETCPDPGCQKLAECWQLLNQVPKTIVHF